MMLAEALDRENDLAATKVAKAGARGLKSAQRRPVKSEKPAARPLPVSSTLSEEDAEFFENLLAPAPAPAPETNQPTERDHD